MPLLKNSNELPVWSELDYYEIINLAPAEKYSLRKKSEKEILFLCRGDCEIITQGTTRYLQEQSILEPDETNEIQLKAISGCNIVLVGGNWSDETGTHGIFTLNNSSTPKNIGDLTEYKRTTEFDNHYHDCDEYWIFTEGKGVAVSENIFYTVDAGGCIATRMGDHHDFPEVYQTMRGIWFETSLKGKKRKGHLWNHTHGAPEGII